MLREAECRRRLTNSITKKALHAKVTAASSHATTRTAVQAAAFAAPTAAAPAIVDACLDGTEQNSSRMPSYSVSADSKVSFIRDRVHLRERAD